MRRLHIANTDFEFELTETSSVSLEKSFRQNPIVHQLQFLPIVYAEKGDGICVSDCPDPSFADPSWHLFSDKDLPYDCVESWAPSKRIALWTRERNLTYHMPDWNIVKEVNSKAFSFQQVNRLPGAKLIHSWDQLHTWMQRLPNPKVLKTCFGLSGRGHLHLPAPLEKIENFAMHEFNAHRPLIGEPWVARKLDFSTQWVISKHDGIAYVGATVLQNDAQGRYLGNLVGKEETIFGAYLDHLHAHRKIVYPTLERMQKMGFFGNVGIDAMIWGNDVLHPIVEINARKTMGWISLQIAKRLFPNQTITVSYLSTSRRSPLLPKGVVLENGKVKKFSRNLYVDVLAN